MHISWLGGTAIKLQTKAQDEDVVIVIDPYKPETGAFPRSLAPTIAILTRGEENAITLSGEPFTLATPGECDLKGVLMTAVAGNDPDHCMVRLDVEGLSVAHLGLTATTLNEKQREILADVDILCLPVGGGAGYDPEAAVKMVNSLEPKIVIPYGFQSDNDPKALPASAFAKEMGAKVDNPETKVIIKKKDLPTEDTQVIILAKE